MLYKLALCLFVLLAPQSIAAQWSPDGQKIAFSFIGGPEDIYITDSEGTYLQQVVSAGLGG